MMIVFLYILWLLNSIKSLKIAITAFGYTRIFSHDQDTIETSHFHNMCGHLDGRNEWAQYHVLLKNSFGLSKDAKLEETLNALEHRPMPSNMCIAPTPAKGPACKQNLDNYNYNTTYAETFSGGINYIAIVIEECLGGM